MQMKNTEKRNNGNVLAYIEAWHEIAHKIDFATV